jgi:hypothetical protein
MPSPLALLIAVLVFTGPILGCSVDADKESEGTAPEPSVTGPVSPPRASSIAPETDPIDTTNSPRFFDPSRQRAQLVEPDADDTQVEIRAATPEDRDGYYEARNRADRATHP